MSFETRRSDAGSSSSSSSRIKKWLSNVIEKEEAATKYRQIRERERERE